MEKSENPKKAHGKCFHFCISILFLKHCRCFSELFGAFEYSVKNAWYLTVSLQAYIVMLLLYNLWVTAENAKRASNKRKHRKHLFIPQMNFFFSQIFFFSLCKLCKLLLTCLFDVV